MLKPLNVFETFTRATFRYSNTVFHSYHRCKLTAKMPTSLKSWLPSRISVVIGALILALAWGSKTLNIAVIPAVFSSENQSAGNFLPIQLRLSDESGNALNGPYVVTLSIHTQAVGGAPMAIEQYSGANSVNFVHGLGTVYLGSINPLPPSIFAPNTEYWINVVVSTTTIAPRIPVGNTPLSLNVRDGSITSSKIANQAISTIHLAPGSVSVTKLATDVIVPKILGSAYCLPCNNVYSPTSGPGDFPLFRNNEQDRLQLIVDTLDHPLQVMITADFQTIGFARPKCTLLITQTASTTIKRYEFHAMPLRPSLTHYSCAISAFIPALQAGEHTIGAYVTVDSACASCIIQQVGRREITVVQY